MTIDQAQLELLADMVAERLRGPRLDGRLVGVREVAAFLDVEESYVYEHAVELGARRLGDGPKARLRFSLREVDERVSCLGSRGSKSLPAAPAKALRRRRVAGSGTNIDLLPIRGC